MRTPKRGVLVSAAVALAVLLGGFTWAATRPLSTRQGVNYQQTTRYIPAYAKAIDFVQRHVQYESIAASVCGPVSDAAACLAALLDWTAANIRRTPEGWPVIDDHVLHIIIRGHGVSDQMADVFTTLATYAGLPAFWHELRDGAAGTSLVLAFVRLPAGWVPVDVERRVVFRNAEGAPATVEQLLRRPQLIEAAGAGYSGGVDYRSFVSSRFLDPFVVPDPLRAELHQPWPRLQYEIRQVLHPREAR